MSDLNQEGLFASAKAAVRAHNEALKEYEDVWDAVAKAAIAAYLPFHKPAEWLPIESAPHGGWILICAFDKLVMQACWHHAGYWNAFDDTRVPEDAVTHWMPLPTPPQRVSQGGEA